MATVTLDSIRQSVEEKYGPFVVDLGDRQVTLVPSLRLPKDKRKRLFDLQKDQPVTDGDAATDDDDFEKSLDGYREMIRIAATSPEDAEALLAAIGDDVAVLMEVLNDYGKQSQSGEASPSAK